MYALRGVQLIVDSSSAQLLTSCLEPGAASTGGLAIGVCLGRLGSAAIPAVTETLVELAGVWLGRTAAGLVVWDETKSWLAVDGSPATIRGVISSREDHAQSARDLLLAALGLVLSSGGIYSLHAAVCLSQRALILLGDSGAGKSTTATALAAAGCPYLTDDSVLIRQRFGRLELLSTSSEFRLTSHVVSAFSNLVPHLTNIEADGKWSLDAGSAFPGQHTPHWAGPLTLLVLGRSARRESLLSTISPADAMGSLISQSGALGIDRYPNPRRHLDLLALMANQAQLVRCDLGTEWLESPRSAAQHLIEQLRSFPCPTARSQDAS